MKRTLNGAFYCYCKRLLTPPEPECSTSFTFDHVRAQCVDGWKRVPCCRKCNHLKGDLDPNDWFWFINHFERWWKTYTTPKQVKAAIHECRMDQARARAVAHG